MGYSAYNMMARSGMFIIGNDTPVGAKTNTRGGSRQKTVVIFILPS